MSYFIICTKNVTITNALQLEVARATPALSHFNYDALPSLKSLNLSIVVFATDTLLYAVTLTFDLEHLQRITCDVMKHCTKCERNRTIGDEVIAISVFDLMTLNTELRVALGSVIIFTKFDIRQLILA